MDVVITEWGLQSYLDLVGRQHVFDRVFYRSILRPDVELLRDFPTPVEFSNGKFWSPVSNVSNGFKMKWHQVGPGNVQLRLPVFFWSGEVFLCEAYVKKSDKQEARMLLKFTDHADLICRGSYQRRGVLP